MKIYKIHNLLDRKPIELLKNGLASVTDEKIIKIYHPDYSKTSGNLFAILEEGRYAEGVGAYYVIEIDGKYAASAGWNEYELDRSIAFALSRMYTYPDQRGKYQIANHILPMTLRETEKYQRVWLTVNEHNMTLYKWFLRSASGKSTSLSNDWPDIYKKFKPIGKHNVYYTEQWVVEYQKERDK